MPRGDRLVPLVCEELGCCSDYEVVVTFACGTGTLGVLDNVTDLSFSRTLDGTSAAQVTVGVPGASPDCCEALGEIRSWCHEVYVYRCGVLVWSGPVVQVTWGSEAAVIDARDVTAWLDRNVIDRKMTWADTDLALIADDLIRDNVNLGSEAGCLVLDTRMSGVLGDRTFEAASGYVGDTLRTLAREGLDFTAVGRRLVLFGGEPLSLLGPLTEDDFGGDLYVVDDGLAAATDAVVVGKGVVGRYSHPDPACGRQQVLRKDESILTQREADSLARRIVDSGYPTPLRIELESPASLNPSAPVCLEQLIPGVEVRVFANHTCRDVQMDLRLASVLVQIGSSQGESVQIGLEVASAASFDTGSDS